MKRIIAGIRRISKILIAQTSLQTFVQQHARTILRVDVLPEAMQSLKVGDIQGAQAGILVIQKNKYLRLSSDVEALPGLYQIEIFAPSGTIVLSKGFKIRANLRVEVWPDRSIAKIGVIDHEVIFD